MSTEMTDEQLIGYCEIHCQTPRALFSRAHVLRMAALAEIEVSLEPWMNFVSMYEDMELLCQRARFNLAVKATAAKIQGETTEVEVPVILLPSNVIPFRKRAT